MHPLTSWICRSLLLILVLLPVATDASDSNATDDGAEFHEWSDVLSSSQLEELEERQERQLKFPSVRMSDLVFDLIDEITLGRFQWEEGGPSLALKVQRKVFDNHDVINSWTVVDRLKVQGAVPIFSTQISGGPIGFSIGSSQGIDFLNIRQVMPGDYSGFPPVGNQPGEGLPPEIKEWVDSDQSRWRRVSDDQGQDRLALIPEDAEFQARFSKYWNLAVFPLRLPLTASSVERMSSGEILSYAGEGSVELGPSVGWSYSDPLLNANAGLSFSTFLRGTFRISVLKEDERFVRVKLSRVGAIGKSMAAGASFDPTFLDGLFLIKNLSKHIQVTPFEFKVSDSVSRSFDVGYRYDLENPVGREAYEQAVKGRFAYSDELAIDESGARLNPAQTGVEKLFSRNAEGRGREKSQRIKIGLFFRRGHTTQLESTLADITLPDGSHKVFTAWVDNSAEWKLFWAFYEKLTHRFVVQVDLDRYARSISDMDVLTLTAEGNIQDSFTGSSEMLDYILEAENSVGKFGIFPRPPIQWKSVAPVGISKNRALPLKHLGRSDFFYRIGFNQKQVESFLDVPESQMWGLLEKAFSIVDGRWSNPISRFWHMLSSDVLGLLTLPLFVADAPLRESGIVHNATRIRDRWISAQNSTEIKERAELLADMFYDSRHSYELVRLVRAALDQQPVAYTVSGYSPVFGRIWERGNSELHFDDIATRAQREIDFDRVGARTSNEGADSQVQGLVAQVYGPTRVALSFALAQEPKAIFLELYERGFWDWLPFQSTKKANVLVYNNGWFKAGSNLMILDALELETPWREISSKIQPDTAYRLRLATNLTGLSWGPAVDATFETP